MDQKSIFEITIGGVKKGFKFGTYSMGIACQKENCTLGELITKISGEVQPLTVIHIIYGGAVSYAKSNKLPVDFDETNVSDWIDELGFETAMKLLQAGLDVYEPKNSDAPATGREKSTKVGQSEIASISQ
jgi:hypothetical protein